MAYSIGKFGVKAVWAYRQVVMPHLHRAQRAVSAYPALNLVLTPLFGLCLLKLIFFWRGNYLMILRKGNIFDKRRVYMPEFAAHTHHKYLVYPDRYLGYGSDYIKDDFKPDPSDIAIDVGVYLGRDAAALANLAETVHAFEPSPRNYFCARKNLAGFENVDLRNEGVWETTNELELEYGADPSDDAFIQPDNRAAEPEQVTVPAVTISDFIAEQDIDEVGFLKVEAEGAEPEIVDGLAGANVRRIVVNTGSERFGEYTDEAVRDTLEELGYEVLPRSTRGRVFARKVV